MQIRKLSVRIGPLCAPLTRILQLPKGLPGVDVTVVSYDLRTYNNVLRDASGQEWDLYSAEQQLIKALPKMNKAATNRQFAAAFNESESLGRSR